MVTAIVIIIVSGALIIGALWGIYGNLSKARRFLVSLAGGALLVSALLRIDTSST